jgi:DNA-binding winged helix-turn-helix (wHTH) protein
MAFQAGRIIRFDVFELDTRSGELRKQGRRMRLPEQSFQVLTLLLAHPGEVVTRSELRQRLWPELTTGDFR